MFMNDERFMLSAIEEAKKALQENEVPVGAVVVFEDKIIGRGHNRREKTDDITSHAEIEAIKEAAKFLGSWNLNGCILYVTLEPCLMCGGAILQSGLFRVVYGADDERMGAIVSHYNIFDLPSKETRPLITKGVLAEACSALLKTFFESLRKQ